MGACGARDEGHGGGVADYAGWLRALSLSLSLFGIADGLSIAPGVDVAVSK